MSYETQDIDLDQIKKGMLALVAVLLAIGVAVWVMFIHFRAQEQRNDVRQTLVDTTPRPPAEPHVRADPYGEWQHYREGQQKILNSYGWISTTDGTVRIPIQRAMEMLVEQEGQR
jgi:hypothetical protein